jgi:uncharacterized membrane protein
LSMSGRKRLSRMLVNLGRFKGLILTMGVFDTAAWTFYALATFRGEISIITAITESFPAIAIMLGITVNKEKVVWHQYVGVAAALAFSFVLAMIA